MGKKTQKKPCVELQYAVNEGGCGLVPRTEMPLTFKLRETTRALDVELT